MLSIKSGVPLLSQITMMLIKCSFDSVGSKFAQTLENAVARAGLLKSGHNWELILNAVGKGIDDDGCVMKMKNNS